MGGSGQQKFALLPAANAAASQRNSSPARAELRFGDSDLCDNNNDRGRVDAACASLTGDGVRA